MTLTSPELYLVRHGETAWSRIRRLTSVTDLDLTDVGVAQASSLCGHLDPAAFGLVLSSPRRRAQRTAQLAGFDPARVVVDDDLAEWSYGDYEGLTRDQVQQDVPGWEVWTGVVPGGETADLVRARVGRVIERAEASGVDRVLCFAHAHVLRALTLVWLDLDFGHGEAFPLDTATISVLGDSHGRRALLRWNAPPPPTPTPLDHDHR
ncbi:MAG: histidine phosphatase family protein [Kineosporiaceae bacterium]|nr:histidine phosphatase family protein [Kineosporiaceae bacterium]MBK7621627.1 histidine phosphatase family protein [Kineosporiaceae bacterium]MBK8077206.1 histidine phosphatase family protein [Kineosporiaceae bacterium]